MKRSKLFLSLAWVMLFSSTATFAQRVKPVKNGGERDQYAYEYLSQRLASMALKSGQKVTIELRNLSPKADAPAGKHEGYTLEPKGKHKVIITGNDGSGLIYGCVEYADRVSHTGILTLDSVVNEAPEMVLRGACVGLQKTTYLPGHKVYEYPYTPENFPWFYDKAAWVRYLDMLVANKMNSLYLWNGHPFASLVRLKDYPFAVEVDSATFRRNEEMFSFLTQEANKRGIFVIQMFYNIILSKPFADHYGLKTQDRHRPITPLISDYTRKSVAAFIEKYPNVGLLVCLGEAMNTYEDDVNWMIHTIIPGVKDGLKALGRTDEPPILLRAHDTDCKAVMEATLPIYHNLYTMHKYTGESLTTYEPLGPWAEMHREQARLGGVHIENVHILANLEPFRWSSPNFVEKTVQAMHSVHLANGLHLYPQASYWDWPYTADKLPGGRRLLQLDRDWMWYATWGRYAWNCHRDFSKEAIYWDERLAQQYRPFDVLTATPAQRAESMTVGDSLRRAYDESGEIAPKLLRRFGITEGNRQTLLLGMFMSQLVNPKKYTVYPGFRESCGPEGETLEEYVQKELAGQPHKGELPLDLVEQCVAHGEKAVAAVDAVAPLVTANTDEFGRIRNDMHCYRALARFFEKKVKAAHEVLLYRADKNIERLDKAANLMEQSLVDYRQLVDLTRDTYLYANSMQTAQRRIPIGGDGGHNKTWVELLPKYEQELANFRRNISMLRSGGQRVEVAPKALKQASVVLPDSFKTVNIAKGVRLFADLDSVITDFAPELSGLKAIVVTSRQQRDNGTTLSFSTKAPVNLLVGYFRDDQIKYAKAPKLETDASANDYGQAEPVLTSALRIDGMPQINVHQYSFAAGNHTLLLPKGIVLLLGFTTDKVTPRDAHLAGDDDAIDWLFY
jgi:hypothetical protein